MATKFNPPVRTVATMLAELVKVKVNNNVCVILEVQPDTKMDMIATGYLDGTETMFRLTKGADITCTVFKDTNDKPYSWSWGFSGYTLVSNATDVLGKALQCCVEEHFHIPLMGERG